jgi:hypothetical protein
MLFSLDFEENNEIMSSMRERRSKGTASSSNFLASIFARSRTLLSMLCHTSEQSEHNPSESLSDQFPKAYPAFLNQEDRTLD